MYMFNHHRLILCIILISRCHLPSGKFLWLCGTHQKMPRVTVMDDEPINSNTITVDTTHDQAGNHEQDLLNALRNLKQNVQSQPEGNAFIVIHYFLIIFYIIQGFH